MKRRVSHSVLRAAQEESGYTLVEVVVATALLLIVLVPVAGTAVYLLKAQQNEPYVHALVLGQQAMEATLHERAYQDASFVLEEGRWRVERTVQRRGRQVTIRVRVFRRGRPGPLTELMTIRLAS